MMTQWPTLHHIHKWSLKELKDKMNDNLYNINHQRTAIIKKQTRPVFNERKNPQFVESSNQWKHLVLLASNYEGANTWLLKMIITTKKSIGYNLQVYSHSYKNLELA